MDAVGGLGLEVRAGVHSGECDVLVSSTVRELVAGSGIDLEDRGLFTLKGLDGERRLFAVA